MPLWGTAQYALGLALPARLVVNVVSTQIAWWRFGVDDPYPRIVLALWLRAEFTSKLNRGSHVSDAGVAATTER